MARSDDQGNITVVLVGRVACRVDADAAPIEVGDSSRHPTYPATPWSLKTVTELSAVIGKALGAAPRGRALIPILVALQ